SRVNNDQTQRNNLHKRDNTYANKPVIHILQRYFPQIINIQITEQLIQQYATVSEDCNPLHHSNHAAKRAGFPKRIAHAMLTMAISTQLITPILLQQNKVERFQVKFLLPVYINDCLTITSHLDGQIDGNTFQTQIKIINQHTKTVMNGKMKIAPHFTNPINLLHKMYRLHTKRKLLKSCQRFSMATLTISSSV